MSGEPVVYPSDPAEPLPISEIIATAGPLDGWPVASGDQEERPEDAARRFAQRLELVRLMLEAELQRILRSDGLEVGGSVFFRGRQRAWVDGVRTARHIEQDHLFDILSVIHGAQVHECDSGALVAGDLDCGTCGWVAS